MEVLKQHPVRLIFKEEAFVMAEKKARQEADKSSQILILPYNDLEIVDGQGTVGIKLTGELNREGYQPLL